MSEPVKAEVVPYDDDAQPVGDVPAVAPAQSPTTLFGSDDPNAVVQKAGEHATALVDVVRQRNLIVQIGQGEHVKVEGWTLLGSMLGVFPITEWTRPLHDEAGAPIGWEARVEAQTMDGRTVGAAEAMCTRDENTWRSRDDFALRSMAQTRATAKALRMPLGFIMQLAGFSATPAEEMPPQGQQGQGQQPAQGQGDGGSALASDKQIKRLHALRRQVPDDDGNWTNVATDLVISEVELGKIIYGRYGKESAKELSKADISSLMDALGDEEKRRSAVEWARRKLAEESDGESQQQADEGEADNDAAEQEAEGSAPTEDEDPF